MKKKETELLLHEWSNYAYADLEAAHLILNQSENYHLSLYHSHQAIEKIMKWFLIVKQKEFPFVHDFEKLMPLIESYNDLSDYKNNLTKVNNFFPKLRYPSGDSITKKEAEFAYKTAENFLKFLSGLV